MNTLLLVLLLTTTPDAGTKKSMSQLIGELSGIETSAAALEELVARKGESLPHLQGAASEGTDLSQRGWAIVGLQRIGGPAASTTLKKLSEDQKQPDLVRNWSIAARINMVTSFTELKHLAALSHQYPATKRPYSMKVSELASSGKTTAEELLLISATDYQLQQQLAPAIVSMGHEALIGSMLRSKDMNVRQTAAAYVGTAAQKQGKAGNEIVGLAVVKALKFNKAAPVPWAGGPLYVPNIGWDKRTGTELVKELIAWYLYLDATGKKEELSKIEHSLNSISLGNVVGYQADWNPHNANHWRQILRSVAPADAKRIEEEAR